MRDTPLIERIPRAATAFAVPLMLGAIALLDLWTAADLSVSFLYVLPVALATRRLGRAAGVATSFASATAWLAAYLGQHPVPSHPAVPYWDALLELGTFLTIALTLALLREANQHLAELALTDGLTGIPNRRAFGERLELEMARARRSGRPFTVVYFDLDRFKHLNDTAGHTAGDELLRQVAGHTAASVRATDLVARLGGDEFALVLPETGRDEGAVVVAKVRDELEDVTRRLAPTVGVSLGWVTFDRPPACAEDVLRAADGAMYAAKSRTRTAAGA